MTSLLLATGAPTTDPASLDRLHDIISPPSVPWWPPATGWLVIGVGLGLIGLLALIGWGNRYYANRYRRTALRELAEIKVLAGQSGAAMRRVPVLIKRVAVSAYPREDVASLAGDHWIRFLRETDQAMNLAPIDAQFLARGQYSSVDCSSGEVSSLLSTARHWIRHHRVPARGSC